MSQLCRRLSFWVKRSRWTHLACWNLKDGYGHLWISKGSRLRYPQIEKVSRSLFLMFLSPQGFSPQIFRLLKLMTPARKLDAWICQMGELPIFCRSERKGSWCWRLWNWQVCKAIWGGLCPRDLALILFRRAMLFLFWLEDLWSS